MKEKFIKLIALNMVLFQLFTTSLAKGESEAKNDIHKNGTLVLMEDSTEENPIYRRYNSETDEYENISIFDDKNMLTDQYGASQGALYKLFERLFHDDSITDELQKYFPWQSFETKEYAKLFYKFYCKTIGDCGCGYAVAADYVFHMFEGREDEFYKLFGFPMYSVDFQYVDFNYELFMLKLFNYNMASTNRLDIIRQHVMRMVYEWKINDLKEKQELIRPKYAEFKKWTKEQYDEWRQKNDDFDARIAEVEGKLKNLPVEEENETAYFGLPLDFNIFSEYLAQYGINVKSTLTDGTDNVETDNILASEDYSLFHHGNDGYEYDYTDTGAHYLYVVGVTDDGKIIVSSWGDMYIFNDENAAYTKKLQIESTNE